MLDFRQRGHFISIADAQHVRPKTLCLVFNVSLPTLQQRLITRPSHPTIPDAETGIRVLGQMDRLWSPPRKDSSEGFDRVLVLEESEQPIGGIWARNDLEMVLRRIETEGMIEVGERVRTDAGRGGWRGRGYLSGTRGRGYQYGSTTRGYGGHHGQGMHDIRGHSYPSQRPGYGGHGYFCI